MRLADGSWQTMAAARRDSPELDLTRTWALDRIPAQPGENIADYLRRIGFSDDQIGYTRRMWGNAESERLELLSAAGALQAMGVFYDQSGMPDAGEGDFRLPDGYDAIHAHLAHDLDIRTRVILRRIEWGGDRVRAFSTRGEVFEAERALITVPLGVLKAGDIVFDPPLPAAKREAIDALKMGPGVKIIYHFPRPIAPPGTTAIYSARNPPMWWSHSANESAAGDTSQPHLWTAFVTGDWARDLLQGGEQAAIGTALAALRAELGVPDLRPTEAQLVNWTGDPFAYGVYSVMPPGAEGAREALAAATGRLHWAGEATAPHVWSSTVHGALYSGQRAAAELLQT